MAPPRRLATAAFSASASVVAVLMALRLLRLTAPESMFSYLVALNFLSVPLGFAIMSGFSRGLAAHVAESLNVASGVTLAMLLSALSEFVLQVITSSHVMTKYGMCFLRICVRNTQDHTTIHYVEISVAIFGLSSSIGIFCALVHCAAADVVIFSDDLKQAVKRSWASSPWGPKPKLAMCDDLEAVAPGDCAICLDKLAGIPGCDHPDAACQADGRHERRLLVLPCKHVFHEACVIRWIGSDISCPLCRQAVSDIRLCTCLCAVSATEAEPSVFGAATSINHDAEKGYTAPSFAALDAALPNVAESDV